MIHRGTWLDGPNTFLFVACSIAVKHFPASSVPRLEQVPVASLADFPWLGRACVQMVLYQ